jgi:phosphohistidine swiveling domain-containing protein
LRPGTYDINSLRYDEAPELYFEWKEHPEYQEKEKAEFRLSLTQLNRLKEKLLENGLTNDILELMDFIKTVIEGREYGKFAFTRNLSKAIQMIGEIGQKEGIAKEECAFLNIRTIYELYASTKDVRTDLLYSIQQGKKDYEMTKSITLPPVIVAVEDVRQFYYPDSEPNYITCNKVCSPVYLLETVDHVSGMEGKIVLIPSADPGYDWIFSHKIKGFITMFGGANSHMAIRAGELSIPAVVGVGKKRFEQYKKAAVIEIDAQGKTIKVLR